MEKQQDRIRIKDIAQMAGVSVGTVDRVLHSRSGVSESSRIKVEEILKKLNYQPNMYECAGFEQEIQICLSAPFAQ